MPRHFPDAGAELAHTDSLLGPNALADVHPQRAGSMDLGRTIFAPPAVSKNTACCIPFAKSWPIRLSEAGFLPLLFCDAARENFCLLVTNMLRKNENIEAIK